MPLAVVSTAWSGVPLNGLGLLGSSGTLNPGSAPRACAANRLSERRKAPGPRSAVSVTATRWSGGRNRTRLPWPLTCQPVGSPIAYPTERSRCAFQPGGSLGSFCAVSSCPGSVVVVCEPPPQAVAQTASPATRTTAVARRFMRQVFQPDRPSPDPSSFSRNRTVTRRIAAAVGADTRARAHRGGLVVSGRGHGGLSGKERCFEQALD